MAQLEKIKTLLEETLNVVPTVGGVVLPASWCMSKSISTDLYRGANRPVADIVIMVTTWPTQGNTLAWAGYCSTDQYGRPIAAHANFGPHKIAAADSDTFLATALHELMHALGFTVRVVFGAFFCSVCHHMCVCSRCQNQRMTRMLDENGAVRANTIEKVTIGRDGKTKQVTRLASPNVVREARRYRRPKCTFLRIGNLNETIYNRYFDCPTLTGLELEDYGGGGSALSHWEERLLSDEV